MKRPPRILYAVTASLSVRFLEGQLRWMARQGYEVHLLASPGPELHAVEGQGVQTHALPIQREIAPFADLRALWRLIRLLRCLRPDIVVAATPKASLLAMLAAWCVRVPVRVHLQYGLRLETTAGLKRLLLAWTERITVGCATRVICCSPSLRQQCLAAGVRPAEKLVVLGPGSSHGVDAARFAVTPELHASALALRASKGIPTQAPVVGYAGRLTRDKGVIELFESFQQVLAAVPDAWLLVRGDFEEGDPLPDALRRHLVTHPQVALLGYGDGMEAYYAALDVLVFPSYREGMPNVPLEAAAAGLPVAGFCATGTVDAVVDGLTGCLVPLGDTSGLSAAVVRYLRDPELRKRHGAAGRERVLREFVPQDVWTRHQREYETLLARSAGAVMPCCPETRDARIAS